MWRNTYLQPKMQSLEFLDKYAIQAAHSFNRYSTDLSPVLSSIGAEQSKFLSFFNMDTKRGRLHGTDHKRGHNF